MAQAAPMKGLASRQVQQLPTRWRFIMQAGGKLVYHNPQRAGTCRDSSLVGSVPGQRPVM